MESKAQASTSKAVTMQRVRITFECEAPSQSDVFGMYDSVEQSIADLRKRGSGANADLLYALSGAMNCAIYRASADLILVVCEHDVQDEYCTKCGLVFPCPHENRQPVQTGGEVCLTCGQTP
jgi:hypothetical protein